MTFVCEKCNKSYKRQCDLNKHIQKGCNDRLKKKINNKDIEMPVEIMVDKLKELKNKFTNIQNILRDNEALTGEKALRNMSYFLTLKQIEHHIDNSIDFEGYDYDLDEFDDNGKKQILNDILPLTRFSKLVELVKGDKKENVVSHMKYLWDYILSNHPKTNKIFIKGKGFDCQDKNTFIKIITILDIDLTQYDDVLGEVYEDTIKHIMIGRTFGQFFTPAVAKKMILDTLKPQINSDGTIPTCCDPTMGTAGFLKNYLNIMIQQAKDKNIELNWNQIMNAIYGKEIVEDTYQLAMANMLICTGHLFDALERGDSIREPINGKFDYIFSNPPYGIQGLKYEDFTSSLRDVYTPIKSGNAVSLFIQAIIYMLNINGTCAIVLPDGKDLFGKEKTLIDIRQYLMKTCDLYEIVYLPADIFNNTGIKTCVFFFKKKKEGSEILTKTVKGKKITYNFSEDHQTSCIKFYELDINTEEKKFLIEVDINEIANKDYSLNYAEYIEEEHVEYGDGVVVKTLGEVCEFQNGKNITKEKLQEGEYLVVGGGQKPFGKHSHYNREENTILCSSSGAYAGYISKYPVKIWASDCFSIHKNDNNLNEEYLYYYLKNIQNKIYTLQNGSGQPHVYSSNISKLKIPIPPLEKQQEIVEILDIYEQANKTSQEKIKELKKLNEIRLKSENMFNKHPIKTLGEVCEIEFGTRIVKSKCEKGEYNVYGGGDASFTTNSYNREGFNILISRFALSLECVRLIYDKIYLNDSGLTVKPKLSNILHKYLGYYLLTKHKLIYQCARGPAQKNLDIDEFKNLQIPIPPLEKQQEIVEYCQYNDETIERLEKELEFNKKQAEYIMNSIVS